MNGSEELRQLAHLLRTGSELASDIAAIRLGDASDILVLAEQALTMAERLDEIAARPPSAVSKALDAP